MKRKLRKYEEPWNVLKQNGSVSILITQSDDEKVIAKYAKTVRKAMQKEKYLDDNFRIKYPKAVINSVLEGKKLRFTIDYMDGYDKITDADFE